MTAPRSFKKHIDELESYTRSGQLEKAIVAYRNCKASFPDKIKQIDWEALHPAVVFGHRNTVRALLDVGVDVNSPNSFKQTALSFAVEHQHFDLAGLLINRGADVDALDNQGRTLLYKLCATQSIPKVDQQMAMLLLKSGADPNFVWKISGCSCLQHSIAFGNIDLAYALIDKGADIHYVAKLPDGAMTALHFAANNGQKDAVIKLVHMGADLFTPEASSQWPINTANKKFAMGTVMALIAAGAHRGLAGHSRHELIAVNRKSGGPLVVDRLSASFYTGDAGLISKALDEDPHPETLGRRVKESIQWNKKNGFTLGLPLAQSLASAKLARMALEEIGHHKKATEIASTHKS